MESRFLFPSVPLFQPLSHPFTRSFFPDISSRKFPLLFPLNFCSTFLVVAKSSFLSYPMQRMQRWRRPIISRREWSRISHFRRPLIEDRCTSRGSALCMDEGTTDHNDPPPRKHNGALALFSGTHCRPENHSAMTKCCVRAPANML